MAAKAKKLPAGEWRGLHHALSHLRRGGLHEALGIPQGQKIPAAKLEEAKNSDDPHVAHMANLASTMKGWHHGK